MAKNRVLLLVACLLILGVPAWQAQNSPAQESTVQGSQVQDAHALTATTQDSTTSVADRHRRIASPEKARSKDNEAKRHNDKPIKPDALTKPVIWQDPGDIAGKDLFWGQGGPRHRPRPPFTFIREERHGNYPKFDCRDANGKKWRVKLGAEARPEVAASRLLWAVGYFVDENYLLPKAPVRGLKMERESGKQKGATVIDARFKRKPNGKQKIGTWKWRDNPFSGTREFNGLRVMMAVINNWDLKDVNNAVQEARDHQQQFFLVSDLGSSFGPNAVDLPLSSSKGNLRKFEHSKFITRDHGAVVDFATPAAPAGILVKTVGVGAMAYVLRSRLDWIGNNVPAPDAHWIGTLLGQLSHQQLVDAFRAGNFPTSEVERYVSVMEDRIRELQGL